MMLRNSLVLLLLAICSRLQAQTVLISPTFKNGGFEDLVNIDWLTANQAGGQKNKWFIDNQITGYCAGNQGAYVGPTSGSTAYTNNASICHLYQQFTLPAPYTSLTLSFLFKGIGESTFDYMRVFVVPVATVPVAGNALTTGQVGANYNNAANCTSVNLSVSGLTPGASYFLVFSWTNDISISNPPAAILDDVTLTAVGSAPCVLGTGVFNVALPYSSGSTTNCGQVNDITATNTSACGSTFYLGGEDVVYVFTPAASGAMSMVLSSTGSYTGMMLYAGCPTQGGSCVANSQSSAGSRTLSFCATAGITYYLVIDSWPAPSCNPYSLTISAPNSLPNPSNDLPCNATILPLNANLTGYNTCTTTNTNEPAAPACWVAGAFNTVWYTVVAPASGQLKIRTTLGSNSNTQIAVYSGNCSALNLVACNANAPGCGTSSYNNSELSLTGLTAGATYYIAVDGEGDVTGTFDLIAIDPTQSYSGLPAGQFPPAFGQDCPSPNPVCSSTIQVGNPGYQAFGNNCDFVSANLAQNCLASGERGSAWYTFTTSGPGNLEFNIIPNNWPGAPSTASTDYDFALWQVPAGTTINNYCLQLYNSISPLRCNYSSLGVTGLSGILGNAPAAYPGFDGSYEPMVTVAGAGETYILVVSNFTNSAYGFTLQFPATAPVNYNGSTGTVVWSGGVNTTWGEQGNWGGCRAPDCPTSAVISPSSLNQPTLLSGQTYRVNNLTINNGSVLTMQANSVLEICGNYTNSGSLVANPTATIRFVGTAVQSVSGALVGFDKFPNLEVNKTAGSVVLNNDIDIGGSFLTANSTSVFNNNTKRIQLTGNFTNNNGNSTFLNPDTLVFVGTSLQTYHQGSTQLDHKAIIMNNTGNGSGVSLQTNMCFRATDGFLKLSFGKIITGNFEVRQFNPLASSVTKGNINSYVEGFLRRRTNSSGIYDFPVGEAAKGYQLARLNFSSNNINNILASFRLHSPLPAGLMKTECTRFYNFAALDNGKWYLTPCDASLVTQANPLASFTTTLFNREYTNAAACNTWTVMQDSVQTSVWSLFGSNPCMANTPDSVVRTSMTTFYPFGTAQGGITLPVELLRFEGRNDGNRNILFWTTASETNNDHFTLERSADGGIFEPIARVAGAGNNNTLLNYEYVDEKPFMGVNYYRLVQTDFDGTSSPSEVIAIRNRGIRSESLNIRPNPSSGLFFLDLHSESGGSGTIIVTDLMGRIAFEKQVETQPGPNTFTMDIGHLARGIYAVSFGPINGNPLSVAQLVINRD